MPRIACVQADRISAGSGFTEDLGAGTGLWSDDFKSVAGSWSTDFEVGINFLGYSVYLIFNCIGSFHRFGVFIGFTPQSYDAKSRIKCDKIKTIENHFSLADSKLLRSADCDCFSIMTLGFDGETEIDRILETVTKAKIKTGDEIG